MLVADGEPVGAALPGRGAHAGPLVPAARQPDQDLPEGTKRIVALRLRKRLGPVQLAALTGVAPSTVHRSWCGAG